MTDPVFQAIAALDELKIHAEEQVAAYEIAEAAVFRARKENGVLLDGEEMRTHEQIDAHFTPTFEDEEQFNRCVERLRPRRLSDAERAERDMARRTKMFGDYLVYKREAANSMSCTFATPWFGWSNFYRRNVLSMPNNGARAPRST